MMNKNIGKKMGFTLSLLLFLSCLSCQDNTARETFIFPNNYEGPVTVMYGQKDGNIAQYDSSGYRIYNIDSNGIFRTRAKYIGGATIQFKFFYKLPDGKLKRLYSNEFQDEEHLITYDESCRINISPDKCVWVYGGTTSSDFDNNYSFNFIIARTQERIDMIMRKMGKAERFDKYGNPLGCSLYDSTQK